MWGSWGEELAARSLSGAPPRGKREEETEGGSVESLLNTAGHPGALRAPRISLRCEQTLGQGLGCRWLTWRGQGHEIRGEGQPGRGTSSHQTSRRALGSVVLGRRQGLG